MSKRSDDLLLLDIYVAVQRILTATEAAKNISAELRSMHPEVDWQGMNGFRNFLIHVYFGVDLSVLWTIIRNDIPVLELQIKRIGPKK